MSKLKILLSNTSILTSFFHVYYDWNCIAHAVVYSSITLLDVISFHAQIVTWWWQKTNMKSHPENRGVLIEIKWNIISSTIWICLEFCRFQSHIEWIFNSDPNVFITIHTNVFLNMKFRLFTHITNRTELKMQRKTNMVYVAWRNTAKSQSNNWKLFEYLLFILSNSLLHL